ncbi:MAG: ribbon-helix-helix domain-containing protein [Aquificota bacterium]|nr:ribbon-helix-helix domain-containing protein [Aquificota bacterium]
MITVRLEPSFFEEVDRVAKELGKSRSALIKEALRFYLQHLRRGESPEGFVPFLEFKRVNEELIRSLNRIKDLEVEVATLKKENELLKKELENRPKRRWFF